MLSLIDREGRLRAAVVALGVAVACAAGPVAPVRAQGGDPLAPVAARVPVHDYRGALGRLAALPAHDRGSDRARYLRGRLLEALGRYAEAADAWEGIAERLPAPVAADARFRRAAALARSGRCGAARPMLEGIAEGSDRPAAVARALLGQCDLADGDLPAAVEHLRAAAREDAARVDTFAVRMALAEALHRQGDREAAVAELRSLLVDRAEHQDADRAVAQLEAWGEEPDFDLAERLARADRLLDRHRPRLALAELEGLEPPRDRADRARLLHLRGMALFGTRHDYAEAARVLGRAARVRTSPTAEEDEFHAARALSRSDQDDRAIAAYRRFVRRHGRHRLAPLAEYLAAWLELRHGRRAGEAHMRRFLRGPRGRARASLRRNAVWHLGLSAFERGRADAAAERFEEYADLGGPHDAMVRGRGLYWLGRARMLAGDRDAALEAWRATLAVEPLHWYAMLARERMAEADADPGPPFGDDPEHDGAREGRPPLGVPALPADVAFYAALGLRGDAVDALRAQEDAVADAAPEGRELEALVTAYRSVGDASRPYRLAVIRARDELRRRPDARNRWVWEAAYPRPWRAEVERVARMHGLPPEYLWAIMRQESGYDPEAVSYADAVGLLQMLPRTAERVAEQLGLELRREMLFDPTWNLRLAAAYNGGLYDTFDHRAPLSIGAFNAGGHRMRAWLDDAPDEELDLFVEHIPFDQTRNYVRRVTTHLAKYLYLEDPDAGWPLTLLEP